MQIGIDARMPYYRMGGISQYVLHLLPALAALDDENQYTIFKSRKEKRDLGPESKNFGSARLWTPCHHRWERWTLGVEIWMRRLDLLHSPDFIPPAFGARHYVITVHDLNFLYYPEYLTADSRRYYAGQIRQAVQQADHIAADSEQTRRDLIERLKVPPQKVTTVYLAANPIYKTIPAPASVTATLEHYGLPPGFVLFVGTLEPRKNLSTLLEAYWMLRQESGIDVPLVLVGSKGWLYKEILEEVRAIQTRIGSRKRIFHLSGVSDEALSHLYRAAGLLALPSHYEGFGLPPLEAMHQACPVVVSNRASLPEIVGKAGILLEPDNVDAWAAALRKVLEDGAQRQRMISAGKQQAVHFSWEQTAKGTLAVYERASGK